MNWKRVAAIVLASGVTISLLAFVWRRKMAATKTGDAAASASAALAPPTFPEKIAVQLSIYDGKLSADWNDWTRGAHEMPTSAPARVRLGGFNVLTLHHAELSEAYGGLTFRYQLPADHSEQLVVALKGARAAIRTFPEISLEARHQRPLPEGWHEVFVHFSELNPSSAPFDRITLFSRSTRESVWLSLDKLALAPVDGNSPVAPIAARARVSVMCDYASREINPLIYGSSLGDWDSGMSALRIGGNPLSRLNWETGALNSADDWFFENGKAEKDIYAWIQSGVENKLPVAVVVPMLGWVAKDTTSVGFPRSKFPAQRKFDQYRPEAGDGHSAQGEKLKPGPPSETSMEAQPELIGRWIQRLLDQDTQRGTRSVTTYILDNEPSLWNTTHRDVRPEPLGYDELLERTIRYGSVIRRLDPKARIAGPAEWGWNGYFFSAKDREAGFDKRPDRAAHGGIPLIPWYLQQLADYEHRKNTRVLDVLDVHFYPAAEGMYGANGRTDPLGAALRIRSTRALWDPSYRDESWINEPIRLIPRLKEWVAADYPSLQISLGEWSFGADDHISGALATAEALGRFGQHGLDSAYYWAGPKRGTKTYWAFRAFRNFDGKGARFLDQAMMTRDADDVSLFASRDADGQRIVAILVNKNPSKEIRTRVELSGCGRASNFRAFSYGPTSREIEAVPGAGSPDSEGIVTTLPAYSIQVLDIALGAGALKPRR